MSTVDLLYGEVGEELRSAVRALLADRAGWASVLARTESAETYDMALWVSLAGELGCGGLMVPEELGGAGASAREAAVVAEEAGRAVAPVPYLGSAVATALLLECRPGSDEVLAQVAGGTAAAVLVPFSTEPGAAYSSPFTVAGGRVSGRVTSVADALPAEVLLVVADGGVHVVAAGDPGVRREPVTSLDMTRQLCDVELTDAPAVRVGSADGLDRALLVGSALLAAEQLGLAERCLELTVEYVKERRQFGRQVGSYQGLKHRLADLWVGITQARAVARYAAGCAAGGSADLPVAAAVAQAHCGPVAVRAAEECVQMHGGIGFTWEHPAHLYLKRAKSASLALGSAGRHREVLAGLVDLPL